MLKILIVTSGTVQNMLLLPLSKILNNKYNFETNVININKLTNSSKMSSYFINIRLFKPIKYYWIFSNILKNLKILKPDIVITGFHFGSSFIEACKRLNIKNVLWDMDGIYFYGNAFNEFKNYDYILTFSKFSEKIFNKIGVRSMWLPLAFDPEIFKPLHYKRNLDIFFAGSNLPNRINNYKKYLVPLIEKYGQRLYLAGYAIRAAKYCKVYAIEPLPRNYKILKINEKLNNVKINSFNIAAGNNNGKVKLFYEHGAWGLPSLKHKQKEFVEVEMKPLDEIINEESIDLIKIDVEGAEDLVLEGARNCLKRTKMVIIERSESFPKAYRILKEQGFKLSKILDYNVLFTKY